MAPPSKVVHLNTQQAVQARRGNAMPPILHTVRQNAKQSLLQLVQALFNNIDDALFEMADRSHSDVDQNMYFDSMRQVRLHRKRVTADFIKHLYKGFDDLYAAANTTSSQSGKALENTADNLSLLHNEELEISVAVAGIVSKITSQFSLPIMQLTKRIDAICPHHDVTERLNPLGPHALANVFSDAIRTLEIDIRVRIILLKLFERFVMEQLGACYEQANRTLTEAGILTDLRSALKKNARNETPERRSKPRTDTDTERTPSRSGGYLRPPGTDPAAAGGFNMLQSLLAEARHGAAGHPDRAHPVSGYGPIQGVAGPAFTGPQVLTVLSAAQHDTRGEPIDLERLPEIVNLGQVLVGRAEDTVGRAFTRLDQDDEDGVNLIGMLFDYILNDRNLAIPMKALIGRLQLPMLKVAVIDKTFFTQASHPARALLNELSSAGIGWSSGAELKRDALYNKIESVVIRLLNNFSDDLSLFESLLSELRDFVHKERNRSEMIEKRVKDGESGKAKTADAKRRVQEVVNQKASGMRLPPVASRFISESWSRVLVYVCVRYGADRTEWNEAVEALDDLLWSVQPLQAEADLERREQTLPDLLERLQGGLQLVSSSEADVADTLATLRATLAELCENDRAFLDDERAALEQAEAMPVMKEIVLAAADEHAAEDANFEPEPELVKEINRITEGVWVEMVQKDAAPLRCKLAAIVQPGNKYIFVNRRGMKVCEKHRMALAVDIKDGAIRVLEESQVFDRALEAVIGNLRQMHRAHPQR